MSVDYMRGIILERYPGWWQVKTMKVSQVIAIYFRLEKKSIEAERSRKKIAKAQAKQDAEELFRRFWDLPVDEPQLPEYVWDGPQLCIGGVIYG